MLDVPKALDPEASFGQPAQEIAVAITITSQVGTNRSIVLQTYLGRDQPISEFHGVLDKLTTATDRQEAKLQIEDERANLALEEKTTKQFEEDFAKMDGRIEAAWEARGKKGAPRMSPQEIAQKEQAKTAIQRYRDGIAKRKERIAQLGTTIAGG